MFDAFKRFFSPAPATTVSEDLWRAAERHLPFLDPLSAQERAELRAMALAFLDRKVFSGAQGLVPGNDLRLSVALQACLPVLKLGLGAYDGWSGIIVYPGAFVIPRRSVGEDGVLHEYDEDALGEAWDGGPVVLAWFDNPADYDGANVVIHEFAHKLDMLNGPADGLPPLHGDMDENIWLDALDDAYEDFCALVDEAEAQDMDTAIDSYAATHPSEFFAVTSEVFFTDPELLSEDYPEVYAQYCRFYRQDPVARLRRG
ncbi:MAG: zinc-dependent peptidase [Moraxellaceae bacterium]|nr:zinc-dependent peptidase [Moraxellaceae bacterium]